MEPKYDNWVPESMAIGLAAGAVVLTAAEAGATLLIDRDKHPVLKTGLQVGLGLGALACGAASAWCFYARDKFSYEGERKLAKQIIERTAEYVTLPENGVGLDVGTGSGALAIAAAKRNPQGRMVGVDIWGLENTNYSEELCRYNAAAEEVENVSFREGDAKKLPFADESFDAVTSNYVYHNIMGADKQELLKETLRVLRKGGTFAIHDVMTKERYGDMEAFTEELKNEGLERVELIPTDNGLFMEKKEAGLLLLTGSALLIGKK